MPLTLLQWGRWKLPCITNCTVRLIMCKFQPNSKDQHPYLWDPAQLEREISCSKINIVSCKLGIHATGQVIDPGHWSCWKSSTRHCHRLLRIIWREIPRKCKFFMITWIFTILRIWKGFVPLMLSRTGSISRPAECFSFDVKGKKGVASI